MRWSNETFSTSIATRSPPASLTRTPATPRFTTFLKGGGYHGTLTETWTQQFDVHGDKNCLPSILPDFLAGDSWWNCGHAGDRYYILNNAFQYTNGLSFKLRG